MILHLGSPEQSEIAYQRSTFPDGQPHFQVDPIHVLAAAKVGPIDLVGAIKSASDLLDMGLAIDAIRSVEVNPALTLNLNISYLLGARMDRRIGPGQPSTLAVFASVINQWLPAIDDLRILDPHSPVSQTLLPTAQMMFPDVLVAFALKHIERIYAATPMVVIPDAGAITRTQGILQRLDFKLDTARCIKKREPQTGKLSGFSLEEGDVSNRVVLIVDDICDGGGTFSGIAQVLRAKGATRVFLCVTHAVMSKGLQIDGIDAVFATDSFGMPPVKVGFRNAPSKDLNTTTYFDSKEQAKLIVMNQFMARSLKAMYVKNGV
jgi:ribose-phosphate pyrophosphokinase